MRAIDADALKEYCRNGMEDMRESFHTDMMRNYAEKITEAFCKDIDEQPTIGRTINLNDKIKVKLTEHGRNIYYHRHDEMNRLCKREVCKPSWPETDKDGYTKMELWLFMEIFGPHIGIVKPGVIESLDIIVAE